MNWLQRFAATYADQHRNHDYIPLLTRYGQALLVEAYKQMLSDDERKLLTDLAEWADYHFNDREGQSGRDAAAILRRVTGE